MADEDLVEAWKLCDGWMIEFCTIIRDHIAGDHVPEVWIDPDGSVYPGPMCLQHAESDNFEPAGVYATKQTWELLVQMFGYTTEDDGEISLEPDLIKPTLVPLEITDRMDMDRLDSPQGHLLEFASYCAGVMGLVE